MWSSAPPRLNKSWFSVMQLDTLFPLAWQSWRRKFPFALPQSSALRADWSKQAPFPFLSQNSSQMLAGSLVSSKKQLLHRNLPSLCFPFQLTFCAIPWRYCHTLCKEERPTAHSLLHSLWAVCIHPGILPEYLAIIYLEMHPWII